MRQRTVNVAKGEPYPLFSLVSIEIGSKCNRTCIFCPNHDNVRSDTYMPTALLLTLAKELGTLHYTGRAEPFIYNEPLRNMELLLWWLRAMREQAPRAVLGLNTNGDYLLPSFLDELFDAGLNQLAINVYSSKDGKADPDVVERGIADARKRAAKFQAMLDARPWIDQHGSLYQRVSTKARIASVQHKYGVTNDGTNFGGGFGLSNRSGNVVWLQRAGKPQTFSGVCTKPFRQLQINHKGEAILCCNDYHGVTTWGNVRRNTLKELWNHVAMNTARAELQDGTRTGLCAGCDYNGGAYKHMITRVKV